MKPIYITDLDGTLLNAHAELDSEAKQTLQALLADGLQCTVATARTAATVGSILQGVACPLPVILMNGVCLYDLGQKKYVHTEPLSAAGKEALLAAVHSLELAGFLYSIDTDGLHTYYENTNSPNAQAFMQERIKKYGKVFTQVNSLLTCLCLPLVYYSVSDKKEKLNAAFEALSACKELHVEFYRDIYNADYWYMEVCSANASKYNAVQWLRKTYGAEKIIGFGDNLNDLPLFAACEESYAVENANPEVKQCATAVIGSNKENGVIHWLRQHAE